MQGARGGRGSTDNTHRKRTRPPLPQIGPQSPGRSRAFVSIPSRDRAASAPSLRPKDDDKFCCGTPCFRSSIHLPFAHRHRYLDAATLQAGSVSNGAAAYPITPLFHSALATPAANSASAISSSPRCALTTAPLYRRRSHLRSASDASSTPSSTMSPSKPPRPSASIAPTGENTGAGPGPGAHRTLHRPGPTSRAAGAPLSAIAPCALRWRSSPARAERWPPWRSAPEPGAALAIRRQPRPPPRRPQAPSP